MPHYKDGKPAKPGDIVRGKGYNQTKETGCIGIVTRVIAAESCNLTVLIPTLVDTVSALQAAIPVDIEVEPGRIKRKFLTLGTEYGETTEFEKIEVLQVTNSQRLD